MPNNPNIDLETSGSPRTPGIGGFNRFPVVLVFFLLAVLARADEYDTLRLKWFDAIVGGWL